jgi:predicted MFS family arabinose efflux permease
VVGYLGPAIGWRNCFYVLGALGIVLAVVMLFLKEPPRRNIAPSGTGGASATDAPRQTFRQLASQLWFALRNCPALVLTIGGGVAFHFILGAATFDQLWYVQERGFDRAEIARMTGWIGIAGGILGNLFGGAGGDVFMRRTGLGRPMFLFFIMLVLAPFNVAYRLVDGDSIWFWVGVFVGYFQLGCFYGPTFSTVQELAPAKIRATVIAFLILTLNFVGLGIGVTTGGFFVDMMIARGAEDPYTQTLLAYTLLSLIAIPLFYFAGRRFNADKSRLEALLARRDAV